MLRGYCLLAGLLLLPACASTGDSDNPFSGGSGSQAVTLEVTNLNFQDATLYSVSGGERRRLGTVTGKANQSFTFDWNFSRELQIEIDLLAGGDCVTRPLSVDPGDALELIIESNLTQGAYCR